MERGMNKIVIVKRKTRLEELIGKYNTVEQARFYIEHLGADFSDYMAEHNNYMRALEQVREYAVKFARIQEVDRTFVPNMIFGANDVVIALGQDGMVANIMKYLDGQFLIGVNPDTARWDGVLLPFEPGDMERILPAAIEKRCSVKEITMAQATLKDGQTMIAVNDLFIGRRTQVSALYEIECNGRKENQSSSGIIISTGLGSTGWYKSVLTQTAGIMKKAGYKIPINRLGWDEDRLMLVVREPYPSRSTQAGLIFGGIGTKDKVRITSKMPQEGVIFSDGMENDALEFVSGMEAVISIADKKGKLVC